MIQILLISTLLLIFFYWRSIEYKRKMRDIIFGNAPIPVSPLFNMSPYGLNLNGNEYRIPKCAFADFIRTHPLTDGSDPTQNDCFQEFIKPYIVAATVSLPISPTKGTNGQ